MKTETGQEDRDWTGKVGLEWTMKKKQAENWQDKKTGIHMLDRARRQSDRGWTVQEDSQTEVVQGKKTVRQRSDMAEGAGALVLKE